MFLHVTAIAGLPFEREHGCRAWTHASRCVALVRLRPERQRTFAPSFDGCGVAASSTSAPTNADDPPIVRGLEPGTNVDLGSELRHGAVSSRRESGRLGVDDEPWARRLGRRFIARR